MGGRADCKEPTCSAGDNRDALERFFPGAALRSAAFGCIVILKAISHRGTPKDTWQM